MNVTKMPSIRNELKQGKSAHVERVLAAMPRLPISARGELGSYTNIDPSMALPRVDASSSNRPAARSVPHWRRRNLFNALFANTSAHGRFGGYKLIG